MSFSSVPRPGAPASLRRLRAAPFRDSSWLALVPGDHIDFVDLDLALQPRSRDLGDQTAAQLVRHDLHVACIEVEFLGDLLVRQVQAHKIEAQDPDPQRLVMAGKDRAGEIIEARQAGCAPVALAFALPIVMAMACNLLTMALRAAHALGPAQTPDRVEALGLIDQGLEVDQAVHRDRPLHAGDRGRPRRTRPSL